MMNIKVNPYSNNPYSNAQANSNERQSFKGVEKLAKAPNILATSNEIASEGFAHLFGQMTAWKPVQRLTQWFTNTGNVAQHTTAAVSALLTTFYITETAKSKKIEEEQKLPLMLNQGIVTVMSIVAGYLVDNSLNKSYDKFINTFMHVNKGIIRESEKAISQSGKIDWAQGLKYAKTLMIFGLIYRFVAPVIATPIANKLSSMYMDKKKRQEAGAPLGKVELKNRLPVPQQQSKA